MTDKTTNDTDNNFEKFIKGVIPFIVLIGIFLIVIYYLKFKGPEFLNKPELWGSLGDFIGGILNPIISFCTLMIAYAVWKLQKEEMTDTKKALEDQAKTSEQHRREQRFFDLLNLYNETVTNLVYEIYGKDGVTRITGKSAITFAIHRIPNRIRLISNIFKNSPEGIQVINHVKSNQSYSDDLAKQDWNEIVAVFLPYFKVTISILQEIKNTLKDDHNRYAGIFRNQITPSEACLLGLYLCFTENNDKDVSIIKEYQFLQHAIFGPKWINDFLETYLSKKVLEK